ncbi:hypothetical protein Tco_0969529 [Tanacetum coccineum]
MSGINDTKDGICCNTSSPMNNIHELKIGDEFLKLLRDNAFNGMDRGDVIDHIARIVEITEWIKIPDINKNRLWVHAEISPFTRIENFRRRAYANIMNEWGNNHCLNTNHISEGNHEARNGGGDQENHENMDYPTPDQSNCNIRRFEMMKYSFNNDEEYITIKESEHLNHFKKILDAHHELLRLTNEGWVMTTPDE